MSFLDFVKILSDTPVEFEHLKVAQLAQAILESGRGSSDLFTQHNNPFGMKYRSEMADFADSVSYTDHAGETDNYCKFQNYSDAALGYWRFIDRDPYSGWRHSVETPVDYVRFIAFAGYVGGPHASVPDERKAEDRKAKNAYVRKVQRLFDEAEDLFRKSHTTGGATAGAVWKRKGVFIDVGHGSKPGGYDPGAVHDGTEITEHQLNLISASTCEAYLSSQGVPVRVDDGNKGNYSAGLASAGYDVFVSVHHNSVAGNAQGAEAFSHASKGTRADAALAKAASTAMATELGIRDRGPKLASHGVTSGARDAGVRAAILAEVYFMQDQNPENPSPSNFDDWSRRGGTALGRAIYQWLSDNA